MYTLLNKNLYKSNTADPSQIKSTWDSEFRWDRVLEGESYNETNETFKVTIHSKSICSVIDLNATTEHSKDLITVESRSQLVITIHDFETGEIYCKVPFYNGRRFHASQIPNFDGMSRGELVDYMNIKTKEETERRYDLYSRDLILLGKFFRSAKQLISLDFEGDLVDSHGNYKIDKRYVLMAYIMDSTFSTNDYVNQCMEPNSRFFGLLGLTIDYFDFHKYRQLMGGVFVDGTQPESNILDLIRDVNNMFTLIMDSIEEYADNGEIFDIGFSSYIPIIQAYGSQSFDWANKVGFTAFEHVYSSGLQGRSVDYVDGSEYRRIIKVTGPYPLDDDPCNVESFYIGSEFTYSSWDSSVRNYSFLDHKLAVATKFYTGKDDTFAILEDFE